MPKAGTAVSLHAGLSDEELLSLLRESDSHAYQELWSRHIGAALRFARRTAPRQAEDLAAEAFLAVYHQVTAGGGPTSAFRAYLFTVMRNTAQRWQRESNRYVLEPDWEETAADGDATSAVESAEEARTLLRAFEALPERWQRVLWLTEIEGRRRPAIAAEFGLRPNAVSVLYRRAQAGLREEWLKQQIPAALRETDGHIAAQIPGLVMGTVPASTRLSAQSHLRTCASCAEAYSSANAAFRSRRKGALLITGGFAALGVVLPAASAPVGTVAVASAIGLGFVIAGAATVVSGILGVGLLVAPLVPGPTPPPAAVGQDEAPPPTSTDQSDSAESQDTEVVTVDSAPLVVDATPTPAPTSGPDPATDILLQQQSADSLPDYPLPLPTPPEPVDPDTVPVPGDGPDDTRPFVEASYPSTAYLAPSLGGEADAGTQVAIDVDGDLYLTTATEEGWSYDLRPLGLPAGQHTATVWTIAEDGTTTPASAVTFEISELVVEGLDDGLLVDRESEEGIQGTLFSVTAAPSSTVCLASDTGQTATIQTDEQGYAQRRIRFITSGVYGMHLAVCDGEYFGPEKTSTIWASAGIFDPWVDEPQFEIVDP
ncbi:sigma-70 family RNA polymerase sigma factor [Microbacteriaceae bacterium VKM Ac-2854]|nr:sigma-70 family RNA polymerase sigma factor [Microbacteriaceae bacterium VKM Ac-2854]